MGTLLLASYLGRKRMESGLGKERPRPLNLAVNGLLFVIAPAVLVGAILVGEQMFFYAMPLIVVWIQILVFVGVAHLRFYDIEVRAARSGELAAGAAEAGRIAVMGELMASLAHEIRNPLTGVRSLAQRLAEDEIDEPRRRRYAGVILQEVARVERLVTNLLGLVRKRLEERQITRLGGSRSTPIDVRVIAATHQPLDRLVAEGAFREDLLYRLRVVMLEVPPLRQRREDIPPLVAHFLADFGARHGRTINGMTDAARRALLSYDWPGNVRELRNAIERAVVLAESEHLGVEDLPPQLRESSTPISAVDAALAELPFADARSRALEAFDRSFLRAALERHGGNVSQTARALQLHRQSLQKLLRRLEIGSSGADQEV